MTKSTRPRLVILSFFCLVLACRLLYAGEEYEVVSPDRNLRIHVSIGEVVSFRVDFLDRHRITFSPIALNIAGRETLGRNSHVEKVERSRIQNTLKPVVPVKNRIIQDSCNRLVIDFSEGFQLEFKVYNDGAAYRFLTALPDTITINNEEVKLHFSEDVNLYFPVEESFLTHSERLYEYGPVGDISADKMAHLPILAEYQDGTKLAFTEADLQDYPGLYLSGSSGRMLSGIFPAFALQEKQTRDRTVEVATRADYIARTRGTRAFPWRTVVLAAEDKELAANQMVYKLSPECRIPDPSWIRPGKVAWDWWNATNIKGVNFRAGINTETYKYYIDFASLYGIEYIILDEGWSDPADLFKINPNINMNEILQHGKKQNVGIILWVVWKTLDNQLQRALDLFQQWGVSGIKVDFMQRDDQWMVNYYWKIAEEAAKRHLLVDFHGSYKPCGLRRAYPNVLTREGVKGLENNKWSRQPSPEHNLILPFTRMLAGPMDYTPGAMINAQEKNFFPVFDRPMSLGTRCHQLAMYVVFDSPLQMLADSPSNYLREPECMEFLGPVPTVWDKTLVLEAKVGDYILIARQRGGDWYIGAMTDWTPRELELNPGFLGSGVYRALIFQDGINADRNAGDYQKVIREMNGTDVLRLKLAPGGGWAARLSLIK